MRIQSIAKKKVSDFLLGEAGQVGRRGTFSVAALASASGLAAFLVATPPAEGAMWCDAEDFCAGATAYCCDDPGEPGDRDCFAADIGMNCEYAGP